MYKCRICSNESNNRILNVREMMFNTGETFEYFQCSQCSCIQLVKIPEDMQKYYPDNYSAYRVRTGISFFLFNLFRKWSAAWCIGNSRNPIGWFLYKLFGAGFAEKFAGMKIPFDSKIMDVGTGAGQNLLALRKYGFTNLSGIDLYIDTDIAYQEGIQIKKTDVFSITGKYDVVMLNHVFEHMDEQKRVVQKLHDLVDEEGLIMIRTPVNDCYSYRKYGTNWVALDAPRHFYVHSVYSITRLFKEYGLELIKLTYDSSEYQFWASEQYQRGISLIDSRSYHLDKGTGIFTRKQIRDFKRKAKELNRLNDGNAAIFFFKKESVKEHAAQ